MSDILQYINVQTENVLIFYATEDFNSKIFLNKLISYLRITIAYINLYHIILISHIFFEEKVNIIRKDLNLVDYNKNTEISSPERR